MHCAYSLKIIGPVFSLSSSSLCVVVEAVSQPLSKRKGRETAIICCNHNTILLTSSVVWKWRLISSNILSFTYLCRVLFRSFEIFPPSAWRAFEILPTQTHHGFDLISFPFFLQQWAMSLAFVRTMKWIKITNHEARRRTNKKNVDLAEVERWEECICRVDFRVELNRVGYEAKRSKDKRIYNNRSWRIWNQWESLIYDLKINFKIEILSKDFVEDCLTQRKETK